MTTFSGLVCKSLAIAIAGAITLGATSAGSMAAGLDRAKETSEHWSAWGGTVGVRWNRELADDLGLVLGAANGRHAQLAWREHEMFDLRQTGSLEFDVRAGNLHDFIGGSLQARGGYVIDSPAGRIDLTDFRLSPRAGDQLILDIVGGDGKAWFYIDRLMYELVDNNQRLAVRTMDLRISPELADRIGHPEVANWAIADMQMTTDVLRQGGDPQQPSGGFKWHGQAAPAAGATYQADLFMQTFNSQYSRCDGCTGEGGNGRVVFTPSSTLRNNVNNGSAQATIPGDPLGTSTALWTADIPWWEKFSGNHPPYNNDQHPFLIWNLYRFNADGSIDQIGRSGVKHAFLTTNSSCLEHPGTSQVLGRGCSDTYGTGNNDSNSDLGPRSEIIPATNQWGRCGSIYDLNCDGQPNGSGNGNFDQRLITRESQFSGPGQAGATYLFESWYLARQDINIYNSMATKRATFTRNASTWSVGGNDQYRLGPAIDRWVDPANPGANARSVELASTEGHTKVAVKATSLGGGLWRYDYAVMNLDFARAKTQGAEPNLRVISNMGFDSFTVPVGSATITNVTFSDGDLETTNNWATGVSNGTVVWATPTKSNALNWGTMFRFSFTANLAPTESSATLHVAETGTPQVLQANGLLAPGVARAKSGFGNNAP
ncbi:Hypothetical protein I596_1955 [Dokdonella koreensis DS-123]|uniref:Uncharacterized protein n=2 Tax=Dokdonella TaxID=323413 RepID=A0A160DU68_9GAMM|nr:Hypothetical protein I596_1955 [Dokdonella koreensis DS-123]